MTAHSVDNDVKEERNSCVTKQEQNTNILSNYEPKRKVSISQIAIQADNERRKRSSSHSIHKTSNGNNGYANAEFSNGYPGENRNSISSYSLSHFKKRSESINHSIRSNEDEYETNSWWYLVCLKCRQKEVGPGWEPNFWSKVCPHPFCPSYRHVARITALIMIGILLWSFVYCLIGETASPGGQLFNMAVLCLTAHLIGWIFQLMMLPALLGMIVTGIFFQNVNLIHIHGSYHTLSSILRKISLVVLLTRAGLDLDPHAIKKLYGQVIIFGIIPWAVEALTMATLSYMILGFDLTWALLLGCIIAAVAPAVVVPCLFRLRNKGYGVAKGIPSLIIAVAGIDDALSVSFFSLFHSIMFSHHSLVYDLAIGPVSLIGGLAFGVIWGFLSKVIPEKEDPFVVPLRVLMLFSGGLVAVFGSEIIGLEGAGPVGVIAAAFVSIHFWSSQGWSIEDNPVATTFDIFWMICQPILFGLTGTQVFLDQLESETVMYGCIFIVTCFIVRILTTILVATGSKLNLKEKIFVSLSWMAKASVQAVLAPAALEAVRKHGKTDELREAETLVAICILSMLITVPIGAVSISSLGTTLLTKAKHTIPTHGWRRSTRPSLRDITIIEEADPNDSEELGTPSQIELPGNQSATLENPPTFTHVK